jgi:hypothetical protein
MLLAVVIPAHAGEYVVFSSGFRQFIERHEFEGDKVLLYSHGGHIQVDAVQVAGFEPEEVVADPVADPTEPQILAREPVPEPDVKHLVDQAAEKYGVDPKFLHGVVAQESAYRADAVSPVGAIGPMQLMPETAAMYGADPYDPVQNVDAGTRYLCDLLNMYQNSTKQLSKTLAAYNAGPGAVAKYGGVPPFKETRAYVRKILGKYLENAAPRKRT